jgi:hypothetical protein
MFLCPLRLLAMDPMVYFRESRFTVRANTDIGNNGHHASPLFFSYS